MHGAWQNGNVWKTSLHRLQTMQFWQESTLKKRFGSILRMLVTSDFTVPWWCRKDRFTKTRISPGKGTSSGWIRFRLGLSSIYSPLVIRWVQKNIPTLNSVKPFTCNGKISLSASMTPSTETILTSRTILKCNLQKNGNLIREHAGIHGLPPII